jgi:hypothetical protein
MQILMGMFGLGAAMRSVEKLKAQKAIDEREL